VTQGALAATHEAGPGLPRGRSRLPSDAVQEAQRARMLRAIVAAVAERGYADVTVADVVRGARVSRTSFYAQFADKEECMFAAAAAGRRLMFDRITEAVQAVPALAPDVDQLRAGLHAYLRFLHDEPDFATLYYLELPSAGRRGAARLAAGQQKLTARTSVWHARARQRHPRWPLVPAEVYRALTGATEELVRTAVRDGRADELPAQEDLIVWLHLRVLTDAG
jgi:AcrR family transcriptional regulator